MRGETEDGTTYYGLSVPSRDPAFRFLAHKKTRGAPYKLNLGQHHFKVLDFLLRHGPSIDSEMSITLKVAQLAARRCELRDIGCVAQDGTREVTDSDGKSRKVKVWAVTDRGRAVFEMAEVGEGWEDPALEGFEPPEKSDLELRAERAEELAECLAEALEMVAPDHPVLLAYREVMG